MKALLAIAALLRRERAMLAPIATACVFLWLGPRWLGVLELHLLDRLLFVWLFVMIVTGAVAIVRHADGLAELLGEPYGTLILTLSVASIEILTIGIMMTTGHPNPTLARDTLFSVVMIVLNGLIGLSLLLGGLRHREQEYNLRGVISYLSVIVSLVVFGLMVPNFTHSTAGPTFSRGQEGFLIVMCLGLYGVFLLIQTTRHRAFFTEVVQGETPAAPGASHEQVGIRSRSHHATLLLVYLGLVTYLAEKLAVLLDHQLETLHAPAAMGGLLVAVLVLAPEGLSGIRAALANRMQRAVNILLGSVLATLSLTIPAVVTIGLLQGSDVILGLDPMESIMLMLTLLVSILTFVSGRTNILQGAVHLMLFLAYLMLIVWH
ncbi:MAG: ionic transporter y4hA [Rubrivivax sp.]